MIFNEKITLLLVGASIALFSSLLSLFIQHWLQLQRTKRSERQQREKAIQIVELESLLSEQVESGNEPIVQIAKIKDAIEKELNQKDLKQVPSEKFIELYLTCHHHLMEWAEFQSRRHNELSDRNTKLSEK